jgi:hypothetical protein
VKVETKIINPKVKKKIDNQPASRKVILIVVPASAVLL